MKFFMKMLLKLGILMLMFNLTLFWNNKLIILMKLELIMFFIVMLFSKGHGISYQSFFIMMLAIMMVLDSVYGICVLISSLSNNKSMTHKIKMF